VHVNCPFEEPLVPTPGGTLATPGSPGPRSDPEVRQAERPEPAPEDVRAAGAMLAGRRGIVVIGTSPTPPGAVVDLARGLGWPVLAEPTSGVRSPDAALVLAAGQALIRSTAFMRKQRPEVVLQVGATPTSRATQSLVATVDRVIVVDSLHPDPDPEGRADLRIRCDPGRLARVVAAQGCEEAPASWTEDWRVADSAARRALDDALDATAEPTELRIARDLAASAPEGSALFVGNSMPVRDLDYAMAPRDGLRVLANRGASGIDGLVSTALGLAVTAPTVALIGDLSLVHDAGAMLWSGRTGIDATFVIPNNGGGAIFSFLDQRDLPEFERLFTTPHRLDLRAICSASGAGHERVKRMIDFGRALERARHAPGVRVVEVVVDAERNRRGHDEIQRAVDHAVDPAARRNPARG